MTGASPKARGSDPLLNCPAPPSGGVKEDAIKPPVVYLKEAVEAARKGAFLGRKKMDEILSAMRTLADQVGGIDVEVKRIEEQRGVPRPSHIRRFRWFRGRPHGKCSRGDRSVCTAGRGVGRGRPAGGERTASPGMRPPCPRHSLC